MAVRSGRIVGAASLLAMSGCALLTGLGDFEIGPDVVDGSIGDGTASDGSATNADSGFVRPDGSSPFDGNFPFPFDSSLPDANQPDTGGPESGPAGAGIIQCSATLQCTDRKVCCFNAIFPVPSCNAPSGQGCPIAGQGLACDDDTDCSNQICCITPDSATFSAFSSCKDVCGAGSYHACTADPCPDGMTCKHVTLAPAPIKACQ